MGSNGANGLSQRAFRCNEPSSIITGFWPVIVVNIHYQYMFELLKKIKQVMDGESFETPRELLSEVQSAVDVIAEYHPYLQPHEQEERCIKLLEQQPFTTASEVDDDESVKRIKSHDQISSSFRHLFQLFEEYIRHPDARQTHGVQELYSRFVRAVTSATVQELPDICTRLVQDLTTIADRDDEYRT